MKQQDGYLALEFLFVFLGWLLPLVLAVNLLFQRFENVSELQVLTVNAAQSYASATNEETAKVRLKAAIAGSGARSAIRCSASPCLTAGAQITVTLYRNRHQASHTVNVEVLP
jgi:hypothetical protein